MSTAPLLSVRDAVKHFPVGGGRTVHALNGVSLDIAPGESVGLVGESGSGKTTLGRLILRLDALTSGSMVFDGHDLSHYRERQMKPVRPKLQMVFQSPYASLNPRMKIGALIEEPLKLHGTMSGAERKAEVRALARRVALSEVLLERHVNQASGGQLQRASIARAIATRPKLLVLDEPTSSLDLSVRAEILSLLNSLKDEHGMAMLFISHDLDTVRAICDRVCVMYLGRIVETGSRESVFEQPAHPYTRTLLSAQLSPDPRIQRTRLPILGEPPSPISLPPGCGFAPRCSCAEAICEQGPIAMRPAPGGAHFAACVKVDDLARAAPPTPNHPKERPTR
jgi:oligopeptide/dipeptide ABC transporter ATP-binding protein